MTANNQDDPIVMYLIVRESILDQMGLGKTCAQTCHAAQLLQQKIDKLDLQYEAYLRVNLSNKDAPPFEQLERVLLYTDWLRDGIRKVVLRADEKEWAKLKEEEKDAVLITDSGYTKLPPETETVIGLFPMRKSQRSKTVKRLQALE